MSERTPLHDGDEMPFGKFRGEPLGEVPSWYWRWFLKQPWSDEWPDLIPYAQLAEGDVKDD